LTRTICVERSDEAISVPSARDRNCFVAALNAASSSRILWRLLGWSGGEPPDPIEAFNVLTYRLGLRSTHVSLGIPP
jgi:hypothetical protein